MKPTSKLTEELIDGISKEIEDGLPIHYACDLHQVSHSAFNTWMKQGEYDQEVGYESPYYYLYIGVKKAYAQFIKSCKEIIKDGRTGWQGTAWWLERTNRNFTANSEDNAQNENITVNTKMKKK